MKIQIFIKLLFLFLIISCSTENTPVYQLNTSSNPSDGGSVSPTQGEYDEGDVVEITASPDENWMFIGWQGDGTGSQNPLSVTMDSDKDIVAHFELIEYNLNVQTQGEGTVEEEIIQSKSTDYSSGTQVQLTAQANDGWEFVEWQGDLSGNNNPEQITIDSDKSITAVFEIPSIPQDMFVGSYTFTQVEKSSSIAGDYENGWVFEDSKSFTSDIYVNHENNVNGRIFSATPLAIFDEGEKSFAFKLETSGDTKESENTTVTLEDVVWSGFRCDERISYGPVEMGKGHFNRDDDSEFTLVLLENSEGACDVEKEEITFVVTKNE